MWPTDNARKTCHAFSEPIEVAFVSDAGLWPLAKNSSTLRVVLILRYESRCRLRSWKLRAGRATKSTQREGHEEDLCRDFLSTDTTKPVQTYCSTNGGMLASLTTRNRQLPRSGHVKLKSCASFMPESQSLDQRLWSSSVLPAMRSHHDVTCSLALIENDDVGEVDRRMISFALTVRYPWAVSTHVGKSNHGEAAHEKQTDSLC